VTSQKILVREDAKARARGFVPVPDLGWYLLGGLGLVFAVVGGLDILLAWYPTNFGDIEWKFATVTATLSSFPLLSMGIVLLVGSALARGRRLFVLLMVAVLAVLILIVIGCGLLYLPQISAALNSVTDPINKLGLRRSILKTCVQLALYPLVFIWIAIKAFKQWRST
jgi:hypothetical protein